VPAEDAGIADWRLQIADLMKDAVNHVEWMVQ
jgi:hypothetical protein